MPPNYLQDIGAFYRCQQHFSTNTNLVRVKLSVIFIRIYIKIATIYLLR